MRSGLSELFSSISSYYDLLNHIISLNNDRRWRRKVVAFAGIKKDAKVLDLCTGTAEMAISLVKKYPECSVIGVDFSHAMLKRAKEKIVEQGLSENISLVEADILSLPFRGKFFDAVLISFGLRNISDWRKCLYEITNFLKNDGVAIILEFSPAPGNFSGRLAGFYIKKILPLIASLSGGSREAYAHLSSSISAFISPEEILKQMELSGLKDLSLKNLCCGVVNLYCGRK